MQTWADPRIPAPEKCVLRHLLDHWADSTPGKVFATFADGAQWTYADMRDEARRAATGLRALGVCQRDKVLCWLPNGPDMLRAWFGINYLGAVFVPVNTAYRGSLLSHVVRNSGAALMVAHASLLDRLAAVDTGNLSKIVVVGGDSTLAAPSGALNYHPARVLQPDAPAEVPLAEPILPWDLQQIIYTSGTTGPSKGVLCTYVKATSAGSLAFGYLARDDVHLINLPLFHVAGMGAVYNILRIGASIALVDAFSTSTFWDTVRRTRSTAITLMGVMATFLMKQPPAPGDREHALRSVMMVPLSEDAQAFSQRFGCDVYTVFNMTETSCPLVSSRNPEAVGSCGKARAGIEARLVDANDCEVPNGTIGELVLRADVPWSMATGYLDAPEASAALWRNGWLHTGDGFRRDEQGNYFFVDRIKDAIRRRGENISSFEVETEVCAYSSVREAAAYAVPGEHGEDEVMVAVALRPGDALDISALMQFLSGRMAHFMVPRFVRVVDDLPKTPTQKVQKHLLRAEGITSDAFDRVAHGIIFKREAGRA